MTAAPSPLSANTSSGTVSRVRPAVHRAVEAPLCSACRDAEMAFFDVSCTGCVALLSASDTSLPQMFAVLRQWTPQTQQNIDLIINQIVHRGGHIDDRDGLTDMTLLHYASKAGARGVGDVTKASQVVETLLAKAADPYSRCRWTNMAAIHYAAYFDVAPVVRLLLDATKRLDINSPCIEFDHGTPLHIAAANLACDAVKVLLDNGADLSLKDDLGRVALDCVPSAAEFESSSDMGQLVSRIRELFSVTQPKPAAVSPPGAGDSALQRQARVQLQSLGLKIGDRVVVGGVKTGVLRFCGVTEFANGIWAGIELDEPAGKNNGSVGKVSYFKCSPKYGIFAPISKVCRPGVATSTTPRLTRLSRRSEGRLDTSHVSAKIDTGLCGKSPLSKSLLAAGILDVLEVGDRVLVAGQRRGILRFIGETDFAPGNWYGVELEKAVGKNDGCVNDRQYFQCKPKHGVFAPPSRVQKISDSKGSCESLESATSLSDRQRRLSGDGPNGSQGNLSMSNSRKTASMPRPKSSGNLGIRRSLSSTNTAGELRLVAGMSVFCNNELGVIRYIGGVEFAEGTWLGVELRKAKGKNDGSVQGRRYFTCRPDYGLLVRPSKVTVRGINGAKLLGETLGGSIDFMRK